MAIVSFKCKETDAVFEGKKCPRFQNLREVLERKLGMLDAAATLAFLTVPPKPSARTPEGEPGGSAFNPRD